jgi:hypothetical protein
MKKLFSIWMAIMMVAFMGCGEDDGGGKGTTISKLAPPAWIQGSWTADTEGKYVFFTFTSDNIIQEPGSARQVDFKQAFSVYVQGKGGCTMKETKKDNLYEVTITASGGGEYASAFYSFKKGDGTYIEVGMTTTGTTIDKDDYETFYKKP